MSRCRGILIALILLSFAALSCYAGTQKTMAVAEIPIVESGGLGLTRGEWDRRFGPVVNTYTNSASYRVAWDDYASVIFTDAPDQARQVVEIIDIHRPPARISLDEASSSAVQLLPQDVNFVGRSRQEVRGKIVVTDRFESTTLGNLFRAVCVKKPEFATPSGEVRVAYTTEPWDESVLSISVNWGCPHR